MMRMKSNFDFLLGNSFNFVITIDKFKNCATIKL